jgi:hypothetical protein
MIPVGMYVRKLIYVFLIIWVGALAPLIFFENFSSHRGVQSVQFSLLEQPGTNKLPTALRQMWVQHTGQWPSRGLNTLPQLVTRNISLPGVTSSITIFHDSYLLSIAHIAGFLGASPAGRVLETQLTRHSVWLPPPEKPPPFSV